MLAALIWFAAPASQVLFGPAPASKIPASSQTSSQFVVFGVAGLAIAIAVVGVASIFHLIFILKPKWILWSDLI